MGEIVHGNTMRVKAGDCHRHRSFPSYDLSARHSHNKAVKSWWNDPETRRKKRVAQYKFYSVEGKVKSSFKKGFRWIKRTCSRLVHGF